MLAEADGVRVSGNSVGERLACVSRLGVGGEGRMEIGVFVFDVEDGEPARGRL